MSGLSFWAVWNKLRLHDASEESWSLDRQNQILGRWNGFFTPVGIGLQRLAMIEFAKVFDPDTRTVSLTNLLEQAKRDPALVPHAGPTDLATISARLKQADATREAVMKLRHKRLAHAEANPPDLPPLMSQSIESFIDDIKFAFNALCAAHDNSSYSWDSAIRSSGRNTNEVLGLLLKEIERAEVAHDDKMVEIVVGHIRGMETTLGRSLDAAEIEDVAKRQFSLTAKQIDRVQQERGGFTA
jgi:hypothetical protein